MSVNMDLVKQLREKTQVGMMDCKKALVEAQGDMEKAIEILRKRGAAVAAKRADNATDNGRIEAFVTSDARSGAIVGIACETDFSANTESMRDFAMLVARHAAETQNADIKSLQVEKVEIKNVHDELLAKISEKIEVSRLVTMHVEKHGLVAAYIHPGSTIGVMLEIVAENDIASISDDLKAMAKDICMHIAVTNPVAVKREDLDPVIIEKERALAMEQMQGSNKPADILNKIIEGKINKYCSDICLNQQAFIKNEDVTVGQLVQNFATKHKNPMVVKRFVRLSIGR